MTQAKFTPGPWQIVTSEHPHKLGGKHIERRIFTEWHHPQMKGPMDVVGLSIGLGADEGSPAIRFTSISEPDARLIAAAPELLEALKYARRMVHASECDIAFIDAAIAKATGPSA